MAARRSAAARAEQAPASRPAARSAASPTRAASLDRLVHDRTRLAIVSALAVTPTLSFNELKALTETTDGNLSVHARKLEEAGYVACTKGFEGRVPRTEFTLTDAGRRALQKYLDHMEAIIKHARSKGR
jgi:DNA-binding transcriptional ArsR family regulator